MRTLTKKYLGGLPITSDQYEADLQVVDRYQSFAGELLRLSLLGLTGYGFLVVNVGNAKIFEGNVSILKWPLTIGTVALGISAATALYYRYFATDCLTHFIRRLRIEKRCLEMGEADSDRIKLEQTGRHEERSLAWDNWGCRCLLWVSALSLALGAGCVAYAFIQVLSQPPVPPSASDTKVPAIENAAKP